MTELTKEELRSLIRDKEETIQGLHAKVRKLEEKKSRDETSLENHERELQQAKNEVNEAEQKQGIAVAGTALAGVGSFILAWSCLPPCFCTHSSYSCRGCKSH